MAHCDRTTVRGVAINTYPRAPPRQLTQGPSQFESEWDLNDKERGSISQRIQKFEFKRKLSNLARWWLAYCNAFLVPVHKQRQVLISRYRDLSSQNRERLLFLLSTLVGTALFFGMFECMHIIAFHHLQQADAAFVLSYTVSYLMSIIWQHALNRYLVFPSGSYCLSLLHTYLIYSLSYAVVATLGTFLLKVTSLHPRTVTAITLPISGAINYYLLSGLKHQNCLSPASSASSSSSSSSATTTKTTRPLLLTFSSSSSSSSSSPPSSSLSLSSSSSTAVTPYTPSFPTPYPASLVLPYAHLIPFFPISTPSSSSSSSSFSSPCCSSSLSSVHLDGKTVVI